MVVAPHVNPIPLLPASSLDLSLTIVVVVGVIVLFYLSEAFGWVFSGLIVPGYLGSILAVSPAAGATVAVEAVATLAVALLLSEGIGRTGAWSPFFGRDRFLLLVLVSVLVRQQAETWALPGALGWIETQLGHPLVAAADAHSVGLVLVPLTANALWRRNPVAGVVQVAVPVAMTWALLDRVLLGHTNLSLGSMALTYEDPSLDFLTSARAYVVLLTGAILASRFNVRFGWNAGGILVPALLALAWLEPERLAATAAETVLLVALFALLTRLPVVRRWNLEGGRRLALLFALAACLRLGAAWAWELGAPLPPSALAGFGYLLSSLLAAKVQQARSFGRVLLPAFATAGLAFFGGGGIVWSLEQWLPRPAPSVPPAPRADRLLATVEGSAQWARVRTRLDPTRPPTVEPPAGELRAWRLLWSELDTGLSANELDTVDVPPWLRLLAPDGRVIGGRPVWVLAEAEDRLDATLGWGTALLRPGGAGPLLVVPHPWSDPASVETAVPECARVDCRGILFRGIDATGPAGGAYDVAIAAMTAPIMEVVGRPPPATAVAPESIDGLGDWLASTADSQTVRWDPSAEESAFMSEVLVPSLFAARTEEIDPALAGLLGLRLFRLPGSLAIGPGGAGPMVVVRRGASQPIVIEVPHPQTEPGTARIGATLYKALDARALLVDPMPDTPGVSVLAFDAAHLALRRALVGEPDAIVLTVRGLGTALAAGLPEQLVVGVGVPVTGEPPPVIARLFDGPLAGRWTVRWAADAPGETGLTGSQAHSVQVDRTLGGVTPAVLWFSPSVRDAWRSRPRETVAAWVAGAGLDLPDGDAGSPLLGSAGGAPPESLVAALAPLTALATRARTEANVNLLRRLAEDVGKTHGAALEAAWDAEWGLPFLELRMVDAGWTVLRRIPLVTGALPVVEIHDASSQAAMRAAVSAGPAELHAAVRSRP